MVDLLRDQHAEVDTLFRQIDEAAVHRRQDLSDRLSRLLVAHAAIEREIVYPALAKIAEHEILRSYEELAVIEQCLAKLCEVKVNDRTFEAKVAVLEDIVRHHVDQEDELLRTAAEQLEESALARLHASIQERFDEVLASDHRALLAESVAASAAATLPQDCELFHAAPAEAIPDEQERANESSLASPRRSARKSGVRTRRIRAGMLRGR